MKKIVYLLFFAFMHSWAMAQVEGFIFTTNGTPTGTYNKFSLQSCYAVDTPAGIWYVSKTAGVWSLAPKAKPIGPTGNTGATGATGAAGAAGTGAAVSVASTTQTASNTNANVTNTGTSTNVQLNYFVPTGVSGGSNTDWAENVLTGPDKYGAIHSNTTIAGAGHNQAYADSAWPNTAAVTTDNVDWAALQQAMYEATTSYKILIGYGDYFINKSVQAQKYFSSLTVSGGYFQIWTVNNNAFDVIGRPAPTDQDDAEVMHQSLISIVNLQISTLVENTVQVGINLGPSRHATYDGVRVVDMYEGIHTRYESNTCIKNGFTSGCINGWTVDMGNWTGATSYNSGSSNTVFQHCRAYMPLSGGGNGIGIYASSGSNIHDCIIEGAQCVNGVINDALGDTTSNISWAQNLHIECNFNAATGNQSTSANNLSTGSHTFTTTTGLVFPAGYPIRCSSPTNGYMEGTITSYNSGTGSLVVSISSVPGGSGGPYTNWNLVIMLACTNAAVKVTSPAGNFVLDGAYGQYAAIMLDGEGVSGPLNLHVEHVYSWFPYLDGPSFGGNPASNKYLRNRGNNAWYVEWNDQLSSNIADIADKFINNTGMGGTAASAVTSATLGSTGNGNKKYIDIPSPR